MPRVGARLGFAAASGVLALIITAIALGYLFQSACLLLEANAFCPPAAASIVGAGALVLAALVALLARHFLRPATAAKPVAAVRGNGVADNIAADLGALVAQQILIATREHPYGTMGAALAAGLAVGAIPELRKTLTGLLKH
jgi:hypothetical protein